MAETESRLRGDNSLANVSIHLAHFFDQMPQDKRLCFADRCCLLHYCRKQSGVTDFAARFESEGPIRQRRCSITRSPASGKISVGFRPCGRIWNIQHCNVWISNNWGHNSIWHHSHIIGQDKAKDLCYAVEIDILLRPPLTELKVLLHDNCQT
jgi:hypothetical protein